MNCPLCSHPMDAGVVAGRSPGVKFKPSKDPLGDLSGTLITSGFFNHSADAFRCPECHTVVIPGTK